MKPTSLENNPVQTPTSPLARLSGAHGYRFDGNTVHLNAMFALLDPAAHERSWALQLWACPSAPTSAQDLVGHIVAEVALPPMGELADEIEHFEVSAFAWPPAGGGEHVMVLVLGSGRPGHAMEVHDLAVYPHRERFVQPRMSGTVRYEINGEKVRLSVGRIENPRGMANRSGTLSLELWALPVPFQGGRFQGHQLAGAQLGSLQGQGDCTAEPVDLAFTPPPTGDWQIVLMLREWTASGFMTRDFTNFATRFISAPEVKTTPAPVVEQPSIPGFEEAGARPVVNESAKGRPNALLTASPAKRRARASAKRVSVNTGGVEDLAAVTGLSKKLAERIVKKRPFEALDELRRVKGLGAKVLAKVRSRLRL